MHKQTWCMRSRELISTVPYRGLQVTSKRAGRVTMNLSPMSA
jgi:hypothetical protein